MESIQGLVEHIVYHNDTNGYTAFFPDVPRGKRLSVWEMSLRWMKENISRQRVNIRNIRYMEDSSR